MIENPFAGRYVEDLTPLIEISEELGELLTQRCIAALGISGVEDVRQGKYIEVELAETSEDAAKATVERMCKDLLANSVIENYAYELAP